MSSKKTIKSKTELKTENESDNKETDHDRDHDQDHDNTKKHTLQSARSRSKATIADYTDIFHKSILTHRVSLTILQIGNNIKENLEKKIAKKIEGVCIKEGYIKPNSVLVLEYSSGIINSDNIEFIVVFECMVCHPVEGMKISTRIKTITKAGIHAEYILDDTEHGGGGGGVTPIIMFVARDHHNTNEYFNDLKEGDIMTAKVLGIRYELNDTSICCIGELRDPEKIRNK